MIAILPTNTNGSSALPLAAIGTQPAQSGSNGFASTLAAAQNFLNSGGNGSASQESGSQKTIPSESQPGENGSLQAESLQPDLLQSGASQPTRFYESYGSRATGAKILTMASVRTPASNAPAKQGARVNSPISLPSSSFQSSSAPTVTTAHTSQLILNVVPPTPQPPIITPHRTLSSDLPFAASQPSSAPETLSEESITSAPSNFVDLQAPESAAESSLPAASMIAGAPKVAPQLLAANYAPPNYSAPKYAGANCAPLNYIWVNQPVGNYGASQQVATAEQPEQKASFPVLGKQVETQKSTEIGAPKLATVLPTSAANENVPQLGEPQTRKGPDQQFVVANSNISLTSPATSPAGSATISAPTPGVNTNSVSVPQVASRAPDLVAANHPLFEQQGSAPAETAQSSATTVAAAEADAPDGTADKLPDSTNESAGASVLTLLGTAVAADNLAAGKIPSPVSGQVSGQVPGQVSGQGSAQISAQLAVADPSVHAAAGNPSANHSPAATTVAGKTQAAPTQTAAESSASTVQTPFSVFFSDAASATESAALVLPKMILPASFSAAGFHLSQPGASNAAGATQQISGAHSAAKPSVAPQPAGAPTVKQSPGENTTTTISQATRANSDSAASLDVGSAESAAVQTPAAASAQINLATSGQPGAVPNSTVPNSTPQMPLTAPGSTSSSPALLVPSAAASSAAEATAPAQILGAVQAAQLLNRAGQSEMRIGLNTSAFGSVEVRTTVRTSDVGLVIGSEKGDLHALLANELPAVASSLQQQNLRLNSVNFMQGFAFSNNASGGGNPQQQRAFVPMHAAADPSSGEGLSEESSDTPQFAGWSGGSNFSILA